MKRLLLVVPMIFLLLSARSQSVRWGVEGGLNLSGGIARETGVVIHGDPALGYALGVLADIPLANPQWSIRPNLLFQHEASNANIFGDDVNIRVNYFNLPIDVIYHSDLAQKKLLFGLGPWFAYGLSGKYTQQGYTYAIEFGSNQENDAHHGDFGLDFLVGYQLADNMMLTAKFDLGLPDVSAQPDFDTIHTRSFGVCFVYMLPASIKLPTKGRQP